MLVLLAFIQTNKLQLEKEVWFLLMIWKFSKRCKSLRNLCFQEENSFIHNELGWNYRMTNIQAALGIAQLRKT